MLAEYPHPSFGQVRSVGLPLTMGGFERTYRADRRLDGDQAAILEELGYAGPEVAALRSGGAFGSDGATDPEGPGPS